MAIMNRNSNIQHGMYYSSHLNKYKSAIQMLCFGILGIIIGLLLNNASSIITFGLIGFVFFTFIAYYYPEKLIYILVFLLPFRLEWESDAVMGARVNVVDIIVITILVTHIIKIVINRSKSNDFTIHHKYIYLGYLFIRMLTLFIYRAAEIIGKGGWVLLKVSALPLIYLIVSYSINDKRTLRRIVMLFLISMGLVAILGICQFTTGNRNLDISIGLARSELLLARQLNNGIWHTTVPGTQIMRAFGSFFAHNAFASFLSVTICITYGLLLNSGRRRTIFWIRVLLILQSLALLFTFSRGGWMATIGGLMIISLLSKRKQIVYLLISLGLIILILSMLGSSNYFVHRVTSIFSPTEQGEFTGRMDVWKAYGERVLKNPLLGSGNMGFLSTDFKKGVNIHTPHNNLICIAYESGVLGLFCYLFIVLFMFRDNFFLINTSRDNFTRGLSIGIIGGIVSYNIAGMFEVLFYNIQHESLFWFMFGVTAVLLKLNHIKA